MICDLVPQTVAAQAAVSPDALAVADSTETLTYRELDRRAARLAAALQGFDVGPDAVVAVCLDRSAAFVVAALGVLQAGAAYLPLDPGVPPDRLAFMLEDAAPRVLVTESRLAARLPFRAWPRLDIHEATLGAGRVGARPDVVKAGHLAYVIYTSGSTGRPKGVEITHAGLGNLVAWHRRAFGVTADDRAPLYASPAFDAAVWEIWPYLASGASVHLPPDEIRTDPEALRDWLVAERITIGFVPTPVAERLIGLSWPAWTALRTLLTGADTLHRYPPESLPFTLINNYGPTECAVVTTSGPVEAEPFGETLPTIGRPIDNMDVLVLDEALRAVPMGAAGELYIAGAGLARGYRGRPDLTAERFVPHPDEPGARLYRTGDRARLLADGRVAFLGRVDDQVKIRGYRVEPDEITAALGAVLGVAACAVVAREDEAGERRLVAYVVADGVPLGREALTSALSRSLPEYMVPATFVVLPALPLTTNGKVDRAALPAPDAGNTLRDGPVVAPRTEVEVELAAILSTLLGVEEVSVSDNFFLLGGHSLLGTQLIVRVRDVFGVDLPLRTLFDAPTVADLANEIERARLGAAA
ncbi:MAG TPA: non-ribosomal peptide synthetase [Methylomirabilota bacterium]|jgi:amino acid adenylation domain-containing protein|nr:non-ribosomal peptide synthetase [Methylomirabilota bacterium]